MTDEPKPMHRLRIFLRSGGCVDLPSVNDMGVVTALLRADGYLFSPDFCVPADNIALMIMNPRDDHPLAVGRISADSPTAGAA